MALSGQAVCKPVGSAYVGSNPTPATTVMSQDIEDTANLRRVRGVFLWPARWAAGCLVALVGVEGELAQEFAGGGVDDADVQVLDEEQDAGSGVAAAGADVVEPSLGAEGDEPGVVDAVGADAVVGVGGPVAGDCLGAGCVGGGRGGAAGERAVRALGVIGAGEGVEQGLKVSEGGRLSGLGAEPVLHGLLEPLGLSLGLGVVRLAVLLLDPEAAKLVLQGVAAAPAAGQPGGEDHAVVGQGGGRGAVLLAGGAEGQQDGRPGDPVVRGQGERVAGVVVEPGQDLGIGPVGERVVGGAGLPALVRHVRLEPDVGRLRPLGGVRGDQPGPAQVPADGRG